VLAAFAAMHVAFRAFKQFTFWGRLESEWDVNFSPGAAMVVVALAAILLRRRPAEAGLSPHPVGPGLRAALVSLVLLVGCGLLALPWLEHLRPAAMGAIAALALVGGNLAACVLLLWLLARHERVVDRIPVVLPVGVFGVLAVLPAAAARAQGRGAGWEALSTGWLFLGAGVGEEVFFRGYVQSRLNEAFGRPWRLFGVPFGLGLFGASALFALVHILNTTDYFTGVYRFRWWHGLATFATLYYGLLRERTGSVAASAVVHGYVDLIARMPRLLAGG
jgi:membrane protease YdiL (CAAX protease family)